MSNHQIKQESIILFFAFVLFLFFGVMSLVNPYWTGYATTTILLSAIVTWGVAAVFQFLMEVFFGIRFNIRGQTTMDYKYTTTCFGFMFAFIMFLITAIVAFAIDQNLSQVLIPFAEKYRDGNMSNILGWISIVIAAGAFFTSFGLSCDD